MTIIVLAKDQKTNRPIAILLKNSGLSYIWYPEISVKILKSYDKSFFILKFLVVGFHCKCGKNALSEKQFLS